MVEGGVRLPVHAQGAHMYPHRRMNNYDRDPRANAEVASMWRQWQSIVQMNERVANAAFGPGSKSNMDKVYERREALRSRCKKALENTTLLACLTGKNVLRLMAMCSSLRPMEPHAVLTRVSLTVDMYEDLDDRIAGMKKTITNTTK